MTNNFELAAEDIIEMYKRRWQIESLFKQLKQNFPLKYFLGDNVNAIESQIWVTMIANLLLTVVRCGLKRAWSFSGLVSVIRLQLMCYISLMEMLENPEKVGEISSNYAKKSENYPYFDREGLGFEISQKNYHRNIYDSHYLCALFYFGQ